MASVMLLEDGSSLLVLVVELVVLLLVLLLMVLVFVWEREVVVEILNPSCDVVVVGELLDGSEGLSNEGDWRMFIMDCYLRRY